MARKAERPWFRAEKNTWYATIGGKKLSLKVQGFSNLAEAERAWHRLMAGLPLQPTEEPKRVAEVRQEPKSQGKVLTVKDVSDAYLQAKQGQVKPTTHYGYRYGLETLCKTFGKVQAETVKVQDVSRWLNALPKSSDTKRAIGKAALSAFKFAEEEGLISSNPMKGLKRPPGRSRGTEAVISGADHERLLAVASEALKRVLVLLRETGARPSEVFTLKAGDVDLLQGIAVIREHKTSAHGKQRFLVLTPLALEVLKPLMASSTDGSLLRNSKGTAWDKDTLAHAIRRARKLAGLPKAVAYGYRHSFATDALAAGVPDATVAALLGHGSTTMLHKHYSHLTARTAHLKDAMGKVRPV